MITLYGMTSPNVVKIVIALEEFGLDYEFKYVDVLNGDQFEDSFGELTPNRKVPVLIDSDGPKGPSGEDFKLWESGAILIYLAEREGRFMSADPAARYTTLQWLMFQMASIGPMCGQLSHFTVYEPDAEKHVYARARYATEVKRIYDVAETRLQQSQFLAGEDYSIADMAAWPWLRVSTKRGIDFGTMPGLRRWVETIAARPGVQRALAFIDSLDRSKADKTVREGGDSLDRYLGRGRWARPEMLQGE